MNLPRTVPIFPLSGVLLLPRAELPLHVFEPRYRAMTRDALAAERMIAMIQPVEGAPAADPVNPPIYGVGCLGRIKALRETDDGRYYLTLVGLSRFRVVEELPLRDGYRRVVADYADFAPDLMSAPEIVLDRTQLLAALRAFVASSGLGADWSAIEQTGDETLVNALAMLCPFTPGEKQALLECPDLAARAETLTALCEMGARAGPASNDNTPPLH